MTAGGNSLIWWERHRTHQPSIRSGFLAIAAFLGWMVYSGVACVAVACHAALAQALLAIELSLVLVLFGSALHAAARLDDERTRNRLPLLWSTPALERDLYGWSQAVGRQWLTRSRIWVLYGVLALAWVQVGEFSLVALLGPAALVALLVATFGGVLGTLLALRFPERAPRYIVITLFALPSLLPLEIGPMPDLRGPALLAFVVFVAVVSSLRDMLADTARDSLVEPPPPSGHVLALYRWLDAVLMVPARAVGLHRNAFFSLQRARAVRRFSRHPLWLLWALIPAALPGLMAITGAGLQPSVTFLAIPLLFAWWMAGAGATQNSLKTILDQQTMVTLQLAPVDVDKDATGLLWGRLYTLALAWLLGLPLWLGYALSGQVPFLPTLALPLLCGLVCMLSAVGGVRAACTNLINGRGAEASYYSEGLSNVMLWAGALFATIGGTLFLTLPLGIARPSPFVPYDFISLIPAWENNPHLWFAPLTALLIHGTLLALGYSYDMGMVRRNLSQALAQD